MRSRLLRRISTTVSGLIIVLFGKGKVQVVLKTPSDQRSSGHNDWPDGQPPQQIDIPWQRKSGRLAHVEEHTEQADRVDLALIQAVARAHLWKESLMSAEHISIECLAASVGVHSKV